MAQVKKALVFYLLSLGTLLSAQIDTVIFEPAGSLLFPAFPYKSSYASVLDRNGQPYLYSANMDFGLGIYRVAEDGAITLVRDMGIQHFHNLDVAAVKQRGSSLFLGLGDFHVNDNSASGLAIASSADSPQICAKPRLKKRKVRPPAPDRWY